MYINAIEDDKYIYISPRYILCPILYYWFQSGISGHVMKEIGLDYLLGLPSFLFHENAMPQALLQDRGQEEEHCTYCRLGPGPQIKSMGCQVVCPMTHWNLFPKWFQREWGTWARSPIKRSILKPSLDDLLPPRQRMAELRSECRINLSPIT